MNKLISILFLVLIYSSAYALDGVIEIQLNPNEIKNIPASDLVCSKDSCLKSSCKIKPDTLLTPIQIKCLIEQKIIHDASELDPAGDSITWASNFENSPYKKLLTQVLKYPLSEGPKQEVGLNYEGEIFEYADLKETVENRVNISAIKRTSSTPELYTIQLGPKAHNNLLRRALLRKIGYFVPPVQWVKKLKLKFVGDVPFDDQLIFIKSVEDQMYTTENDGRKISAYNWVSNLEEVCKDEKGNKVIKNFYNPQTGNYENTQEFNKLLEEINNNESKLKCLVRVKNNSDTLEIKDAVIFKGEDDITYNFARGIVAANKINGRRLFNAVSIPYVLTDVPVLVNFLDWDHGRIYNNTLQLPYEFGGLFSTNIDDAKWVMRRIAQLTRKDFQEIVGAGELPKEVSLLLVEKIISARNYYVEKLIPGEFNSLNFNRKISSGELLKEGLLRASPWPDYSVKFYDNNLDNPKNPLSKEEIIAYLKSKIISTAIDSLIATFNNKYIPGTNLGYKIFDHQIDVIVDVFVKSIINRQLQKIPKGIWTQDFWNGHLIAARDIIIGSYRGTDNPIQIADTVGFQLGGGIFAMQDGLKLTKNLKESFGPLIPYNQMLTGIEQVYTVWTYTRIKPTLSIEAANNEPFKNILVPLLINNGKDSLNSVRYSELSNHFNVPKELEAVRKTCANLNREKTPFEIQIKTALNEFKKVLNKGESLIIQKSLGNLLQINYAQLLTSVLQQQVKVFDDLKKLNRVHIYRKDDSTIQIFKTPAIANILGLGLSLTARGVTLAEIELKRGDASVDSNFYTINLNDDICKNPNLITNIQALLQVLQSGETQHLDEPSIVLNNETSPITSANTVDLFSPKKMKHKIATIEFNPILGPFEYLSQNMSDIFSITYSNGYKEELLIRSSGTRKGVNLWNISLETLNSLLNEHGYSNVEIRTQHNVSPADTMGGFAFTKRASYQAIKKGGLKNPFASIDYQWRGWSMKIDKLIKTIDEIESKWETKFIPREELSNISSVKLYNLYCTASLYQEALDYMTTLNPNEVRNIFTYYTLPNSQIYKITDLYPDYPERDRMLNIFLSDQKNYLKTKNSDPVKASKYILSMLTNAENNLTFEGFQLLAGGPQNIFLQGSLDGYKVDDPRGLKSVRFDTRGEIGDPNPSGPLTTIMKQLDVNPSEFFAYWLFNKL